MKGGITMLKYWIMNDVKRFANMNKDIYAMKHDYLGEEELEEEYYDTLLFLLPEVITFTVIYGYQPTDDIQSLKTAIFKKIADHKFIEYINGELDKKNRIENIQYLPLIIAEMLQIVNLKNRVLIEDGNDPIDISYLEEFSMKIKKFVFDDFNKYRK